MRPPRLRLRTLMIAVAVAALVMGGGRARRWWACRREWADYHAQMGQIAVDSAVDASWVDTDPETARVVARRCAERARFHLRLVRAYARAATCPWLPIETDPPEPE